MSELDELPDDATYDSLISKKAASTRTYQINLRKFFPPDNEYATCMARLCILREDLSLEVNGIIAGCYELLDGNGKAWRRNYFFRNSSRTLQEIASALQTLNCVPEFKRALKKHWTITDQNRFKDFCKEIMNASELVTEVRNTVGGHVKHSVVARALRTLGFNRTGFWEVPHDPRDRPTHTHHPFINELFIAILQAGDREEPDTVKEITEVLKIPKVMASLIHAIPHIDNLFQLYIIERRLL